MHSCLLVLDYMLIYYTFLSGMQRKRQNQRCEKGHKKTSGKGFPPVPDAGGARNR